MYPARNPLVRRSLARRDVCPECGGALDMGWECIRCSYDAREEALPPQNVRDIIDKYSDKEIDRRWSQEGWLGKK